MADNDFTQSTNAVVQMPEGVRAILVWQESDGTIRTKGVPHDCAVLNVDSDLRKYLDEYPFSDAWLIQLRDYCDARVRARAEAMACGCAIRPNHQGADWGASEWTMIQL